MRATGGRSALANPHALAALTGVQVGAALVASAAVVDHTGAALLAFLRYALGALLLLPFAWRSFRAGPAMPSRDAVPVALLGIGQFGALIWLLNHAVALAAPARVALVFATLPVLTAFIAVLLGRGWPTARVVAGIALGLVGVAVLLGDAASGTFMGDSELAGLALALAATALAATSSLLYRPYLARYGVLRVSTLAMLASLPPLALLAAFEPFAPIGPWGPTTWGLVVFVGASSAVGYLMWLGALARLDAATVTAFLSLSPLTAALLSACLLGTAPSAADLVAMALVAAGLVVMATRGTEAATQATRS